MRIFGKALSFLTGLYGALITFWGGIVLQVLDIHIWSKICRSMFILALVWFAVSAASCVIKARQYCKHREIGSLMSMADKIKFGCVPFFIINFILWLIGFAILMVATRGILLFSLPVTLPVLVGITYILMLITSWFTANAIMLAQKSGCLQKTIGIYGMIAQFIFVADVVFWFVCRRFIKKRWGGNDNGMENK